MDDLQSVKALIERRELSAAEEECQGLLNSNNNPMLHLYIGYVAQQTGRYEEAVVACRRATKEGLVDWSNHFICALALRSLDRHDEALAELEISAKYSPNNPDVEQALLQETLVVRGFEAAARRFEQLPESVKNEDAHELWRRIKYEHYAADIDKLLQLKEFEKARSLCAKAIYKLPTSATRRLQEKIENYRTWSEYSSNVRKRTSGKPKLSVLLITYNHGKFVSEAIEGILNQKTDCDIEIIAVDDCSTDDTQSKIMQYVEKFPLKIKAYFNEKNIGTFDPPQQKVTFSGFQRLDGDYIAILEGDDFWSDEEKISKQIKLLENTPTAFACGHNTIKIYQDESREPHRFLYWPNTKERLSVDDVITNSFFHTSSMLYRNFFRQETPVYFASKWSCDIFVNIYAANHGDILYLDEDMSVYRAHSGGLYSNMNTVKAWIFNIEGYRNYNIWLNKKYDKQMSYQVRKLCRLLLREIYSSRLYLKDISISRNFIRYLFILSIYEGREKLARLKK